MNRRSWTRAGSGMVAAFAAAAVVGLVTPAYADETPAPSAPAPTTGEPSPSAEPGPTRGGSATPPKPSGKSPKADLSVSIATSRIALGSAGKILRFDVRNDGPAVAEKVTVVADVAELSNDVDVVVPGYCKVDSTRTKATCVLGDMPVTAGKVLDFRLVPRSATKPGPLGKLTMSISSDTPDPVEANNTDSVAVTVTDRGVDLAAYADNVGPVKPGRTAVLDFGVVNFGSRAVDGVTIKVTLPQYVSVPRNLQYAECTYSANGREIVCRDDIVLGPGEGYTWHEETPFEVYVSPDAPGPVDLGSGTLTAAGVDEIDAEAVRGTRSMRSVVGKAPRKSLTDVDPGDNSDSFRVSTSENPADLAVAASKASGGVGDTVTVTVSVKNNGPADSAGFTATVTAPTGTELVDAPKACTAKTPGRVYVCQAGNFLDKGEVAEQDFSFRITAAEVGSDGKVTVTGKIPDRKPQNNTAKLSINDTSGGGGGLPVTGYQVSLVAGTGAALLLAGAALVLVTRRRRAALATVTTVDTAAGSAPVAVPDVEPVTAVNVTADDRGEGATA